MPNIVMLNQAIEKESKWLATRALLESDARAVVTVGNDSELDISSAVYTRIAKHIKALEKHRKDVTGPLDDLKKEVMNQERELKRTLESEAARLKAMNDAYATAKYDREQAERQAAIDRMAHDGVSASDEAADFFGNPDVVFLPPDDAIIQPIRKSTVSQGRTVIRWEFAVIDPRQVPREFMSVDESKIKKYRDYQIEIGGEPSIPGVVFTRTVSVESR